MSGSVTACDRVGESALDLLSINTIRTLSMDAVQQANSGHPGTPVALAPVAYTVWQRFLNYDPADPLWPNRDRFVLSVGHASMLLYSMLHLTGVKDVRNEVEVLDTPAVSLEEIKRFRQLDSKTPGHPEYRYTGGVETTTGPLGQGAGNSVGMAIASKWLGARFNKPGFELFNFKVYSLLGDGCMMEGVTAEAASLAGFLKLSNLCWIYDSNTITIEGHTDLAFSEDVGTRFQGYGWNVLHVTDANDLGLLTRALDQFQKTTDKPTLIIVNSVIAWGVPGKENTHGAHGEPLGEPAIVAAKKNYNWPEDAKFFVPDGVRENFQKGVGARGKAARDAWYAQFQQYRKEYPQLASQWESMSRRELPAGWDQGFPSYPADPKGKATRDTSGEVLNALAKNVPWVLGGAADLAPSTKTTLKVPEAGDFSAANYGGRNFHFGIREHAMGAVINGMSLSRLRAYGSGFLIFSDYGRPAIRLAALMEIPVIYVFTHDSIGVGEDGPTHQPIEQIASLRAIPHLINLRPCDANEVVEAWKCVAGLKQSPACLMLTRQALPTLDRTKYASADGLHRGAYILADAPDGKPDVLLLATGSEVYLCVEAYEKLKDEGIKARVVSMPSWELFESYCAQHPEYRQTVLPLQVTARVAVEQAIDFGWAKYVGLSGATVCMHGFGASAPFKDVQKRFGFTTENIIRAAKQQLGRA